MASSESVIVPPILKKIYGDNLNKKYKLTLPTVLIGRNTSSHIVVENPNVSRKHCLIKFVDGKWTIKNYSQNGTYINGRRMEDDEVLQCGDIVFLGPPSENPEAFSFDDIPDDELPQNTDSSPLESMIDKEIPYSSSDPHIPSSGEYPNFDILVPKKIKHTVSLKRIRELDEPGASSVMLQKAKISAMDSRKDSSPLVSMINKEIPYSSSDPHVPSSDEYPNFDTLDHKKRKHTVSLKRIRELDEPGASSVMLQNANISSMDSKKVKGDSQSLQPLGKKNKLLSPSKSIHDPEIALMEKLLESEIAKKIDSLKKAHDKLLKDYEKEREKNEHLHERNKILQEQLEEQNQSSKARLERLACNICTELALQPVVLDCSHTFCEHCIKQWRKRKAQCPLCRQPIKSSTRVLVLDEFIDESLTALSPKEKAKREQLFKEREEAKTPKPKPKTKRGGRRRHRVTSTSSAVIVRQPVRNIEVVDLGASSYLSDEAMIPLPIHFLNDSSSDLNSEHDADDDDDDDVVLIHNYCYNCGNFGHSAANCM